MCIAATIGRNKLEIIDDFPHVGMYPVWKSPINIIIIIIIIIKALSQLGWDQLHKLCFSVLVYPSEILKWVALL